MESSQRNLMIGYSVVCFLSLIGVSLNLVSVFNIDGMDAAQMIEEMATGLQSGFLTIAGIYLLIFIFSLQAVIRKTYSKKGLMLLIFVMLLTFVFGHYIFEFYLDSETL